MGWKTIKVPLHHHQPESIFHKVQQDMLQQVYFSLRPAIQPW